MITLIGTPLSSYTAKVRIALDFKCITYIEREPEGGYRSANWREVVPSGTIPAIDHDGFVLAESEAILEYLEECWPEPTLLPGSAQDRARIRWLARLHDLHVEPRVRALFPLVREPQGPARLAGPLATLQEQITVLNQITRPAPFLGGSGLSLADCGFVVSLSLAGMIAERLGGVLRLPEALDRWLLETRQQPALAKALEAWQHATHSWLQNARPST